MWGNPSRTRSSPFLAEYPGTMSHKPPSTVWLNLKAIFFHQVLPSRNKRCPSAFLSETMKCSWSQYASPLGEAYMLSPEPLVVWNKELEGLDKRKNIHRGYVPCSPWAYVWVLAVGVSESPQFVLANWWNLSTNHICLSVDRKRWLVHS
jgi:hypothetical protein